MTSWEAEYLLCVGCTQVNRVRKGHRKDASTLALKKMLPKPAYEGMKEQLE